MYFKLDQELTRKVGFEVAGFYANLWSFCDHFKTDTIHQTQEQVEKNTGLTRTKQDTAIKKLEEIGLLKKTIKKVKGATVRQFQLLEWKQTQEDIAIGKKFATKKRLGNVENQQLGMSETCNPITIKKDKEIITVQNEQQKPTVQNKVSISQIMENHKYAYLFKKRA